MTTASHNILEPPASDEQVANAVAALAAAVRQRYGDRVKGIYLFGSRARRDHNAESDADVAVVLVDDGWTFWSEKMALTDLAYDAGFDAGAYVQVWPVGESEWLDPTLHRNPSLVRAMRRDAVAIGGDN